MNNPMPFITHPACYKLGRKAKTVEYKMFWYRLARTTTPLDTIADRRKTSVKLISLSLGRNSQYVSHLLSQRAIISRCMRDTRLNKPWTIEKMVLSEIWAGQKVIYR